RAQTTKDDQRDQDNGMVEQCCSASVGRPRLYSIVRKRLAVGDIRQQSQDSWIYGDAERMHAAVRENKLADLRMITAEVPGLLGPRRGQGCTGASRSRRGMVMLAIVGGRIQRAFTEVLQRHVVLANHQR